MVLLNSVNTYGISYEFSHLGIQIILPEQEEQKIVKPQDALLSVMILKIVSICSRIVGSRQNFGACISKDKAGKRCGTIESNRIEIIKFQKRWISKQKLETLNEKLRNIRGVNNEIHLENDYQKVKRNQSFEKK